MPSKHSPGQSQVRDEYADVKARFGENPARWLDQPLVDTEDRREMARIRIQSIDDIALLRAWIDVETDLDREHCPRSTVIAWCNRRIEQLREIGERPDRLPFGPRRSPTALQERKPDCDWTLNGADWADVDREGASVPDRAGTAVATDGGDES